MIRVGIAGYGDTGKKRAACINAHPRMEVVAYCDPSMDGDGAFINYQEMLVYSSQDMDALFVCLPNYLAPDATIMGLQKGLHVFCEKPPAESLDSLDSVRIWALQNQNLKLKYGFNHRYHYSIKKAKELIGNQRIIYMRGIYGKSRLMPFKGNWRSEKQYAGGGILLDQGIHMLDLFRYLSGEEFEPVGAIVSNGFYKASVEDNAYALLRSGSSEIHAFIHSSATTWNHRFYLEIGLEDMYLKLSGILSGTKSYGQEKLIVGRRRDGIQGNGIETVYTYLDDHSWRDEVNEFYECIVNDKPVTQGSVDDAIKTMELVFNIYKKGEE